MATVAVRRYEHSWQAHLDRARLMDCGIDACVCDDAIASIYGGGAGMAPHFAAELHVGEGDVEDARKALETAETSSRPARSTLILYDVLSVVALAMLAQVAVAAPWIGGPLLLALAATLVRQFHAALGIRRELRGRGIEVGMREARWLHRHHGRAFPEAVAGWSTEEDVAAEAVRE